MGKRNKKNNALKPYLLTVIFPDGVKAAAQKWGQVTAAQKQ
jgi:hypothetical protein